MSQFKSARLLSGLGILCLMVWLLVPASCAPVAAPKPPPTPTLAPAPAPAPKPTPAPAPPPSPAAPAIIRFGSLIPGSTYYPVAVAATKVISQYAGFRADPAVYSTMTVFPKRLQDKELDLAILNTIDSSDSIRGLGAWKDAPLTAHRFVASISARVS